ncbi:dihydrolipoyl dehydrogenase [Zunongwangia sp. F363]|uniref:Dihydrolipoyl dehydrogenase n=1 Tax=Autumnicola tepida TaxID=3075595 RepID=A0ABU3CEQ2_9FLAO|nr:dihydrolipoyl dehydrogenase [Zunongwangia sp. F363]MDT0644823.1 dihydrolipoyl dehydrogenase [Zunongwangia sp. F363]
MRNEYDIVVIGSGPGGYVAAIRASQLGYKVAIIEKYPFLGGTCTNVGCIPSKALLDSSEHFYNAREVLNHHGVDPGKIQLNFQKMIARKDKVVKTNNEGLAFLMKKNKIDVYQGVGVLASDKMVEVRNATGKIILITNYIILATGSKPASLPGTDIDEQNILSSTGALSLKNIPESLTVIGGGIIGVEMASVYSRLGSKVRILEYSDALIPGMDRSLGKGLAVVLKKKGINIHLDARVSGVSDAGQEVTVTWADRQGRIHETGAEKVLVAVGRKPYTQGLGLEKLKIVTDERGFITVNKRLQTSVPNIFAIGDVIGGQMLAHKAEEEGIFVAEVIDGQKPHINYRNIPGVVYTWPEVASVGFTEEEIKKKEIPYRKGKFPFSALGRARAAAEEDGFVKVLADTVHGEVLGVHILGARAADLIAQAVVAMEYEVRDIDMATISWAHPTFSEALKEAYLASSGRGNINI